MWIVYLTDGERMLVDPSTKEWVPWRSNGEEPCFRVTEAGALIFGWYDRYRNEDIKDEFLAFAPGDWVRVARYA